MREEIATGQLSDKPLWLGVKSAAWSASAMADHLQSIVGGTEAGSFTFDRALDLLFVCDQIAAMFAIRAAQIPHCQRVQDLFEASAVFDEETIHQANEAMLSALATEDEALPAIALATSNPTRHFNLQIVRLEPDLWMATCEDVTARRAAAEKAIEGSMRDPLTGLANRQLFAMRVSAALLSGTNETRHWMMLVDLDRFKAVNDTLGHAVGDILLKLVAKRIGSVLGEHDLVARLGGDEFALLVTTNCLKSAVEAIAKRLIDMIGRPYLIDGHVVHVGASIGIACAPEDAKEPDRLAINADLAMYASKRAGRNTFSFFERSMDTEALDRRAMEMDLRKAIALRQFDLHYQPQIDLERDTIVGFEALLRWRHPTRGLILPDDFIPLAEEIGLIIPIGEWVLRTACLEAVRWPEPMTVAVNISPCQFEQTAALVTAVEKALAVSGLPGHRLEIEITEGALLRNETSVLGALHRFRAMGVLIAMDDFGTGYASLSQLNSFPFNKIKIDQSFVNGGGDAANNNAIIRAISALGLSLGMATIAEGVETSDELARIRSNGCTSVQGYLFSEALPTEKLGDLIASFADRHSVSTPQAA